MNAARSLGDGYKSERQREVVTDGGGDLEGAACRSDAGKAQGERDKESSQTPARTHDVLEDAHGRQRWSVGTRLGHTVSSPASDTVLGYTTQTSPPNSASVLEVVQRAVEEARLVSGAFTGAPCAFVRLEGAARALVQDRHPEGAGAGEWVLVTVQRSAEAGHQAHLHERCRTAAQRFVLALACEDVESVWVDEAPGREELREAGVAIDACEPVGLVWCAGR